MKGFKLPTIANAGKVVTGALSNAWLSGAIGSMLPGFLQGNIASYAVGLATAGLQSYALNVLPMTRGKKLADQFFFGGVIEVMGKVAKDVLPMITGVVGLTGVGDYLTPGDAAAARPLGFIGDYLTRANAEQARPLGFMSDYLTPQDAQAARPLGDYYGEEYIAQELAAY